MAWKSNAKGQPTPRYKGGAAAKLALPAAKGGRFTVKGGRVAGKGGYARSVPAENLVTVQADFEHWAQYLADLITDLNQPASELSKAWSTVTSLRARLIQLHEGVMAGSARGGRGEEADNMKGLLVSVYTKRKGSNLTKEDLVYTVEALAEGSFMATVTGQLLEGGQYTGETASSKKLAEHAAALAALTQEFPEALDSQPKPGRGRQQQQQPPLQQQRAAPQGEKRKRQPDDTSMTSKARLNDMVQTLSGGEANKNGVVYVTSPVDGDNGTQPSAWTSKVYFPNYDAGLVYEGEPQDSKKEAEHSAAAVAVADLEEQVAPLEAERKAKKQKQKEEKEAQKKAEREMKEAAA